MASVSVNCLSFKASSSRISQVAGRTSSLKLVSLGLANGGFPSLKASRFRVSCAAKPETVQKVCKIVRKQLGLPRVRANP